MWKQERVTVRRDKYGIPHINSTTQEANLYALGYEMARDRLFQIHLRRMAANGRLSEMFGRKTL